MSYVSSNYSNQPKVFLTPKANSSAVWPSQIQTYYQEPRSTKNSNRQMQTPYFSSSSQVNLKKPQNAFGGILHAETNNISPSHQKDNESSSSKNADEMSVSLDGRTLTYGDINNHPSFDPNALQSPRLLDLQLKLKHFYQQKQQLITLTRELEEQYSKINA